MWNLDTGHAESHTVTLPKTGVRTRCAMETHDEETRILGLTWESKEVSWKQNEQGLLGSKQVEANMTSGEVVEQTEGLIFTSSRTGQGSVDKSSGEAHFDGPVQRSFGVREEVQRAAADGIEVAAIEARRVNETRLFCSEEQVHSALKDVGAQAAAQAAAGVGGQVAGDILGTIVDNAAAGSVAGRAVAAGVASALVGEGSCQQRLEQAASSAGTSLSLAAAHEAASSVTGPGSVANVAGRALGALVTSGGSLQDRAAHAAQKGGEAAAAEVLGQALAKANVPLCPRSIINEEGHKGVEFSGGSMMSIGSRHRYGSEVKADSVITQSQHEEGVQFRLGECLSHVCFLQGFNRDQ